MNVAIIVPIFNDWVSVSRLIVEVDKIEIPQAASLSIFLINDGSVEPATIDGALQALSRVTEIEVIDLVCNMGHQRAIAIGLVEVHGRGGFDFVLVMDSDGEDRPVDIPLLFREASMHPSHIICAQRGKRPGRMGFRLWYEGYKLAFRLLTGATIDYGNFSLIPKAQLRPLVSLSSTWNNLAGSIARSRLPLIRLPIDRGERYAGESKMNFVSLVVHGLSVMAIYNDVVLVRLMIATLGISALMLLGILIVTGIKLFSDLAIPGWASTVTGFLSVILLQSATSFAVSTFVLLNARTMKSVVPMLDAVAFVAERRRVFSEFRRMAAE